jgi:hypothetical protein
MLNVTLRSRRLIVLAAASALAASPALAGNWVRGGAFDPVRGVVSTFLRFLAEDGEGQMTIRCSTADGLTMDVGVAGNAALPQGAVIGGETIVDLAFPGAAAPTSIQVLGTLLIRQDGAVLVSLSRDGAAAVAVALAAGADQAVATIGGVTRPVPLETLSPLLPGFAAACAGWPG